MLTPAQVAPFLHNQDPLLRRLAQQYLTQAHDPSPATAEDAWRVIDRFGNGEGSSHYLLLSKLPQTEASLDRTLGAISAEKDETRRNCLEESIVELPYGLLNRFRDKIEAAQGISDELRQHLARRFELASVPPQDLWDQLMKLAQQIERDWNKTEDFDPRPPRQLIEALSRSPESAQFAVSTLNDTAAKSFAKIFAVELLGLMRHRPAVELIVQTLTSDEQNDLLLESCTDALIHIGGSQIVAAIQQRWKSMPWGIKLYGCDVLSGVKLKEAEAALVEHFDRETDQRLRTKIAIALCDTAANDPRALEKLREMISTGRWDMAMTDLDEEVVALFTMVGHHIPELPQWRANLADTQGRKNQRLKAFDELKMSSDWEGDLPRYDSDAPPKPAAIQPIRRDTAKVGRNDPCPCGSGKKFKKCCGK